MGIKIKKSPKPASNQKNHTVASNGKKNVVSSSQKKPQAIKRLQKNSSKKATVSIPSKKLVIPDTLDTSKCELQKSQVEKAVSAAFKACTISLQKTNQGQLFEDDPDPVNLLVSAIKIPNGEAHPFRVKLPNPFLNNDSDICLIVKDLEKGWKVDHEPTSQHYQELLENKNVDCISEIMPLRQLRVEYKPFEARGKFSKRFDAILVDKRVAKFIPRYLGKSFYQAGKLPVSLNIEAENLLAEINQALATSMMSMTNNGTSTQIQVGLSNQTEKEIVENITTVYENLQKNFPGKFANVRSLSLRFGSNPWTVPIYISYASRDTVTLPETRKRSEPLIDDLTTLAPGWKVAVFPSGEVKKVKDEAYQPTALDASVEFETPAGLPKSKEAGDSDDDEKMETEPKKQARKSKKVALDEVKTTGVQEDGDHPEKAKKILKKKKAAEDSSDDEGDMLEEEYMKELDMLEEGLVEETNSQETNIEEANIKSKKAKTKPVVKSSKKLNIKKVKH